MSTAAEATLLAPPEERRRIPAPDPAPVRVSGLVPTLRARPNLVVAGLVLFAALWAGLGSLLLFPLNSGNNDEAVYLLQADALAHGRLFPPAPPHPEPFRPWFSVIDGDHYVPKYTPVHAAMLAVGGLVAGSERLSLAVIAGATVWLFSLLAREFVATRRQVALATALFALSPLFLILSATFLSYCSQLMMLLGFAVLVLRGVRARRPALLAAAGLVAGTAFFARPYDTVLVALPVLAWAAWRWLRRGGASVLWVALGGLPPLALMLAYNKAATGSALTLPFSLLEPLDTFGYGLRRLSPSDTAVDFGPKEGLLGVGIHLFRLLKWCAGSVLLVVLALVALLRHPRSTEQWGLVAASVVLCAGYLVFWGPYNVETQWDGPRLLGPIYFLPLLVPLCLLAARALGNLSIHRRRDFRSVAAGMAAVTLAVGASAIGSNGNITRAYGEVWREVEKAETPALVFEEQKGGPYVMHWHTFARNPVGYDSPVLWADDVGNASFDAIADFPDRVPHLLRDAPRKRDVILAGDKLDNGVYEDQPEERWQLQRLAPVSGEELTLDVAVWNPTNRRRAVLEVATGGVVTQYLLDDNSSVGEDYSARLRVTRDAAVVEGLPVLSSRRSVSASGPLTVRLRTGRRSGTAVQTAWERAVPQRPIDGGGVDLLAPQQVGRNPEPVELTVRSAGV